MHQESINIDRPGTISFDKNTAKYFNKEFGLKLISETKLQAAVHYSMAFSHKTGLVMSHGKIFNFTNHPITFTIRGYQGNHQVCSRTITIKANFNSSIFDDNLYELAKTCDRVVVTD